MTSRDYSKTFICMDSTFKVALGGYISIAFLQIKNHHTKKLYNLPKFALVMGSLDLNPHSLVPSFIMVINSHNNPKK